MKSSEETFLFKQLCQFVTSTLSQSDRYYEFPEVARKRIVSFLAACLMVIILATAWGIMYLVANVLPDNLLGAALYTSALYAMVCANFWVAWLVLTRLSIMINYLPSSYGPLLISGVMLMWLMLSVSDSSNADLNQHERYVLVLAWALTCLRPALFARVSSNQ
ncbi:hypothetical protein [Spirosoma luteum]|uniref:hypothetical protein n=1 Tax=Spirosoma luteum TaxID=431553 RepID=UPI00037E9FFD|nr:hypothetical protein [Spirosoma luteum]